jgi:hypothetical protein
MFILGKTSKHNFTFMFVMNVKGYQFLKIKNVSCAMMFGNGV